MLLDLLELVEFHRFLGSFKFKIFMLTLKELINIINKFFGILKNIKTRITLA